MSDNDTALQSQTAGEPEIPDELPVLPVRDTVLFPHAVMPLNIGRESSIALVQSAKALALIEGRDFVAPEDVQELAAATLAHRIVLDPQAKFAGASGASLVADLLKDTKVPA